MDKLTLDTNVLMDWGWCAGLTSQPRYNNDPEKRAKCRTLFKKLEVLRDEGVAELGVTTQLYTDLGGELPGWIKSLLVVFDIPMASPSIFGIPLGIPFVVGDGDDMDRLLDDVFPGSEQGEKRFIGKRRDILQLYAHRVAGRDFFITEDKGILGKRGILERRWRVRVMSLSEYISHRGK